MLLRPRSVGAALAVAVALSAGALPATAGTSPKVIRAFKGQIVVSADEVALTDDAKATISSLKKARVKEVKGAPNADEVTVWHFFYTAFPKHTGVTSMRFEFYNGKDYVADEGIMGIDPKTPVLTGRIDISEDDGPAKGKTYTVNLVGQIHGKDVTFATTKLTLN
jgi:hypothetical protein